MRYFQFILIICSVSWFTLSCSEDDRPQQSIEKKTDSESIPTINIRTEKPITWDQKAACVAHYIENGDTVKLPARIKFRGGMSSRYDKHSYSIEFTEDIKLCGIAEDDDWILNASYIDKTFQRHKLSYDLFGQMSSNNIAAESGYIKVYLNGIYNGIYVAMEEINASMLGLDKTDNEAMLFKDPPVFYKEKLTQFQEPDNYYQQKFPKISQSDKSAYLDEFNALLFQSSGSEFDNYITDWIDIKNIIDWHLLLLLTNNDDGLYKNFYLYKMNVESPMRIAIWDYDHSFGRDGDGSLNMMEQEVRCEKIILLRRLMESKTLGYSRSLKTRWQELRSSGVFSSENMKGMITANTKVLKPHLNENFERWPLKSKWYHDENDYNQEIEIIKKFVEMRLKHLDEYMKNIE